ncbi:Protein of unknown function [Pyronema omphalodes CBS 100304]|uniref:Uncharacterized protein n=1 Tax=Pyronema omphalodes (strain CBS 100304) TaxID=1076935 RepID=U4KZZ8_PYROM|nr:Protein of unknown function [Pyronema omphalodes CBS 100304]
MWQHQPCRYCSAILSLFGSAFYSSPSNIIRLGVLSTPGLLIPYGNQQLLSGRRVEKSTLVFSSDSSPRHRGLILACMYS